MRQPQKLRLRGSFIDFCPRESEDENVFPYGTIQVARSFSSPPGFHAASQSKLGEDSYQIFYLKDLISRTCELSKTSKRSTRTGKCMAKTQANYGQPLQCPSSSPRKYAARQPESWQPIHDPIQSILPGDGLPDGMTSSLPYSTVTTLMICNIPCKMSLQMMKDLINSKGFDGKYDFLYLPRKGHRSGNLGYAFINFPDAEVAAQFSAELEGFEVSTMGMNTNKVVMIRRARVQGYASNIAKFRNMGGKAAELELFIMHEPKGQEQS